MGKKVMNLKESMEGYMAWSGMMKGKGEMMQLHKSFFKKQLRLLLSFDSVIFYSVPNNIQQTQNTRKENPRFLNSKYKIH